MNKKFFAKISVGFILFIFICIPILYSAEEGRWNQEQIQKIDKIKNEFSFIVFGYTRDPGEVFERLTEKINQEDALFAINDGDLVTYGKIEEFGFFMYLAKKINKPLLTVIGNHDIENNGRTNYYELFGKFYYSFAVGNSYFIISDNANKKDFAPEQMTWLENELQVAQKYKYRFVFMHTPLYDPREGDYKKGHSLEDLDLAKKLNDIFDKNNITMLFVSHIHGYARGVWRKTPYIITGGGGAPLHGTDPRYYFYHYIKVKVSDSGIEYYIIRL